MRELSVPAWSSSPPRPNLSDLAVDNASGDPDRVQFRRQVDGRLAGRDLPRASWPRSRALAKGLVAAGVAAGDRVGIMSRTRYEWTLADFALWSAGAVPVPIYETSSAEQVELDPGRLRRRRLLRRDRRRTPALVGLGARPAAPRSRDVWAIDADALDGARRRPAPASPTHEIDDRRRDAARRQPRDAHLHLRAPPAGPRAAS